MLTIGNDEDEEEEPHRGRFLKGAAVVDLIRLEGVVVGLIGTMLKMVVEMAGEEFEAATRDVEFSSFGFSVTGL